jgi:glycogen synthase
MGLRVQSQSARPKRIFMTTDTVGGVWSYSIDLARHLCGQNSNILLAAMGRRATDSQRKEAEGVQGLEFVDSEFPLEWMPGTSDEALAEASEWLLQLSRQFRPDVVHLNDYVHAGAGWDVPTVVVGHSCVFSWWLAVHGCAPPAEWQNYKRRVTRGLTAASAVVAPSHSMAKSLGQLHGCDPNKLTVISNFSGLKTSPKPKRPEIFAAGRFWDPAKNLRLLEQIAPDIEWPIRVAGDLTEPNNDGVVPAGVHVEGFLSRAEMADRLAGSSIFVHPAKYEPFGLSVLEAARSGCALVLSDIPSLRELWDGCALFASPEHASSWIGPLNNLISSAATRNEYGRRAFERSQAFSAADAGAAYTRLYDSVISGNDQRTRLSA